MHTTSPTPHQVIVLENALLRIEVLPDLGAKIYSIRYKPATYEILWRNPSIPPRRVQPGASYDDHWSGGRDEIFPNDEPAYADSFNFPDHGELWLVSWTSEVRREAEWVTAYLRTLCERAQCLVEKWITLRDGESQLKVRYRITNQSDRPVPHLFKLHPAMAISPGDRIIIPASRYILEPAFLGTRAGTPLDFNSPVIDVGGRKVDLRLVPDSNSCELLFFYGTDLSAGCWQLFKTTAGLVINLSFPANIFRSCWLFASYGGWNDYYAAVPEPCSGYPFRLEDAVSCGKAAKLAPGAVLDAEVVMKIEENKC
jgi:hypothetical protein